MPEQQFKRNIAYKLRIGDILVGKPIVNENKLNFLELGDKKVVRVNVVGNIVDKYGSDGDKVYEFLTIDDGSGQIKIKAFGDEARKLKSREQGQTIAVIGILRQFNEEIYILPETVSEQDPRYLLIRKLEVENERKKNAPPAGKEESKAIKDKILDLIKNSENEGGAETDKIIMELKETSPEIINKEIQKLIEEGIIFEPRPGKVRWLG